MLKPFWRTKIEEDMELLKSITQDTVVATTR